MKALKFKTLGLVAAFLLSMGLAVAEDHKEVKELNKEFKADKATTLKIANTFGDVDVQNWKENKISVEVKITVEHSNANKAKELIKLINVEFSEEGDVKSAVTKIDDKLSKMKGRDKKDFSIDYTVKIPAYINADFTNKFGDLFVDKVDGHADITVKFGTLRVNELTRGNEKPLNVIRLSYSDDESEIKKCNWLNVIPRYSELALGTAQAIVLDSKYSEVSIESVNSLVAESAYDELDIDEAKNISAKGSYAEIEIGKVMHKLELEFKYGDCNIDYIGKDFEVVKIISKYANVELALDEASGFKIEGEAKYGSIRVPKHFKVSKISENTSSKIYGTVGNGKGSVYLETKYGSIELD